MKKLLAFVVVVLLVGCGGGGGGSDSVQTQPAVPTQTVADVSFVNVPTSITKQEVAQGQDHVELDAFRILWKDQLRPTIGQMVFTSESADNL